MAYLRSVFFKISVKKCQTYKMIQNRTRKNETNVEMPAEHAGANFVY